MINIRTLRKIENNGGLTLKNGIPITYKSVIKINDACLMHGGNCGLWLSDGIWYIDKSKRVNTKKEALKIGRECNQISILKWANMSLAYC